jgi:serine/threonine protein kinase
VPLYDYWREPDGAYLVMRWLRGSLRSTLQHGPWSVDVAARLLEQLAGALTVIHRENIVHRGASGENDGKFKKGAVVEIRKAIVEQV